jgi:hypothetical protein
MKNMIRLFSMLSLMIFCSSIIMAQQAPMQNFRPYDQRGLNVFETPKTDTIPFTGFKLRIGGSFTQQFQSLQHENVIDTAQFTGAMTGWHMIDANADSKDDRALIKLSNGFNLAMANLNIDVAIYDGVHVSLVTYLSSRHHQEAWVKGGFVQFDKLLFLKSPAVDKLMENFTLKFGDYEVNYGDQHYRRSDGGNTMYNPFVENMIMDEFTTEIGGEIQYQNSGFIGVFGMTGGEIKGDVNEPLAIDSVSKEANRRAPSIIAKFGYDSQVKPDLRFRLTGSVYTTKSSASNTIFGGDRTGSHYFSVMENSASSVTAQAFSGRINPGFSDQVTAFMINPFIKYHGLEVFGVIEFSDGRKVNEVDKRSASQFGVDVIYRFTKNEKFWVAGRYNTMTADMLFTNPAKVNSVESVSSNRFAISAGWYIIKNLMAKVEYVNQVYKDFPTFDIRYAGTGNDGAKFNGIMIEAAIGF